MEMVTSPSAIVPEVLQKNNYERWSILMQYYLVAQDLWDVVQSSNMPNEGNKREWIKKNALALHAIGISCGTEAFEQIKKIESAQGAWVALAAMLKPPVVEAVAHDLSEHHQRSQTEQPEITLQKFVCSEPISSVRQFLHDHPEMLNNALELAITCGRKSTAHYLYREIPHEIHGDHGSLLLEKCITNKMFDIALDLLHNSPKLASEYPSNFTPIISTLAHKPPQFLSELGVWRRWIYKFTRVKVFPIKPRSPPAGGVGIVQDTLRKCISNIKGLGILFELFLMFIVPLLKLDPLCVLIGVPLLSLVPSDRPDLVGILLAVFICLLVILSKLDRVRIPIGMPLLVIGLPMSLAFTDTQFVLLRVILFALFLLLVSMPLLIFLIKIYKQKLMDEYALEVIRFICGSLLELDENQLVRSGAVEATFQAIKNGIPEIVIELLPKADILWGKTDPEDSRRNMFACAVTHRQEKVAQFLYDFDKSKETKSKETKSKETNIITTIDEDANNILHLAAQLGHHSQLDPIYRGALQLQSELRWFKSVEDIVPRFYNKQKNKNGETPIQVFLREHKKLLKEAEEWMKKTAEICTVVSALVITIMFAAAFTIPGGNNEETGLPVLSSTKNDNSSTSSLNAVTFKVFTVSDAISVFSASSSVLIFMGILTARYTCEDFHISLPMKLIAGLSSLFISTVAMMVAFCATLLILLHDQSGMVIPIIFLATIPVTLFILLQFSLLAKIYTLTFGPYIFHRRKYLKSKMRVCLNTRWWFRTSTGKMAIIFLLYVIAFAWFIISF